MTNRALTPYRGWRVRVQPSRRWEDRMTAYLAEKQVASLAADTALARAHRMWAVVLGGYAVAVAGAIVRFR